MIYGLGKKKNKDQLILQVYTSLCNSVDTVRFAVNAFCNR